MKVRRFLTVLSVLLVAEIAAGPVAAQCSSNLTWIPPTTNTNGTPLLNLAGYVVYWGTTAGSYPNSVAVNNPAARGYTVNELPGGTSYFAVTALNSGGVQSVFSNPASKNCPGASVVPAAPTNLAVPSQTLTAYALRITRNAVTLLPVGTVAVNTPCDGTQKINGYGSRPVDQFDLYLVPKASVSFFGDADDEAVFAACSAI